ncbi:S-adenosyl-L-methionine-dependent methyltransferase [Cantharellus anzutake]|uniref:S-adenosyl-L-methionine-dependent methyltransferase n=1 Tax=Cantharellus anzutake TaxID=1750568 RepID=UPI0019071E47|nr:S-adenosyl-L-methionine-dependent methyltransferase [Cantharellus anzutake]KAF8342640.1 S-adenosyl-L-methionine-dependent methyltransferase [Cantharellus anzutake]
MADAQERRNVRPLERNENPPPPTSSTSPSSVTALLAGFFVLSIISFSDVASQLSLHPLFGSAATARHFPTISLVICLLASFIPKRMRLDSRTGFAFMSLWFAASPAIMYCVGVHTSGWLNPLWGPIAAHILGGSLVTVLGASMLQNVLSRVSPSGFSPFPARFGSGMFSWVVIARADRVLWDNLPLGGVVNYCNMYLLLGLITSFPAALLAMQHALSRQKRERHAGRSMRRLRMNPTFVLALYLALPLFTSVVSQKRSPCRTPATPYTTLNGTLQILDKSFSVTGMILVGETDINGVRTRFLRCDHSLLGGMWLLPEREGDPPTKLFRSIYTAFYLQEAVRLVNRPLESIRTTPNRVLTIGPGIGVAAKAFVEHGMQTTIVEIDPAVYRFARKHFELPKPNQVYLEDARSWVRQQASAMRSLRTSNPGQADAQLFDYVVHDCFSGGGVLHHLYTLEFWEDLKTLMRPSGILGVNYGGHLDSPAARGIIVTLLAAFGECKVYHDSDTSRKLEDLKVGFINLVIICTLAPAPLTFRSPVVEDYLGSNSRRRLFNSWHSRELPLPMAFGPIRPGSNYSESTLVLRDATNRLGEWQELSAIEYWKLMRGMLPSEVWNTY